MCALLAAALALPLAGCRRGADFLPYGREIEGMELMQTLGVDAAGAERVSVAASAGAEPGERAAVVSGTAATLSAAVLALQEGGDGYRYFGQVGQLVAGEELGREDIAQLRALLEELDGKGGG